MKTFTLSLIIGCISGWITFGVTNRKEDESETYPQASQGVIRLLGGKGGNEVPWAMSGDPFESIDAILAEIDSASPARLRGWLNSLIASPYSSELVLSAIVARLAASDPAGAFALLKGEDALEHHLTTVLVAWAKDDLPTAIDAVVARDNRSLLLKNLITGLDGAKCEELYDNLIDRGYHLSEASVLWDLFEQLAEHDLEGSLSKAVDASLNADSKDRSIDHAMTQWYKEDPTAALKWANDQDDPKALKLAMEAFARVAVQNSGAEGLDLVWDQLDEGQRKALLNTGFKPSTEDMESWFAWMDTKITSPILHQDLMEGLLESLRESEHPERMREILSRVNPESMTHTMMFDVNQISRRWAVTDIDGLQEWLETLESPDIREAAERGLLEHWADADPMKVIEFWERSNAEYQTSSHLQTYLLTQLFGKLDVFSSEGDPQALIDLLPEALQGEAMISYISGIVEESPREALRLLENQPDGDPRDRAFQEAVARWGSEDPTQASAWVADLEEGESKNHAAQNLANTWARFDLEAAQGWIADQPASESRDWAIKEYSKFAADYYPQDTLLSLAMTVTAQPMRDELIRETMAGIVRRDPDGAFELAERANLPNALRDEITQMIEKARDFEGKFQVKTSVIPYPPR